VADGNLTGLAKEVPDCSLENIDRIAVVGVDQMEEVADEVGGGGFDVVGHVAGFLECGESSGGHGCTVSVGAFWIFESVGGFVADGIVGWEGGKSGEKIIEVFLIWKVLEMRGDHDFGG